MRVWDVKHLRSQLVVVSQKPNLFFLSVRDNTAFGFPCIFYGTAVTDGKVKAVVRLLAAQEYIGDLRDSYDKHVEKRGTRLSGDQRQRMCLACTLIRSSLCLLLEETMSALNSVAERVVEAALNAAVTARTHAMIINAHRLSTVRATVVISVVDEGL